MLLQDFESVRLRIAVYASPSWGTGAVIPRFPVTLSALNGIYVVLLSYIINSAFSGYLVGQDFSDMLAILGEYVLQGVETPEKKKKGS